MPKQQKKNFSPSVQFGSQFDYPLIDFCGPTPKCVTQNEHPVLNLDLSINFFFASCQFFTAFSIQNVNDTAGDHYRCQLIAIRRNKKTENKCANICHVAICFQNTPFLGFFPAFFFFQFVFVLFTR